MPLPPVPENNTARIWIDYTSLGIRHSMMVRPAVALAISERASVAQAFATVISNRMLTSDSCFGARYSAPMTDFSVPIPFVPVNGVVTIAGNVWAQDPESVQLSITGRSHTTGRDVRYTLFSPVSTDPYPAKNRYLPGQSAVIDTFRENLVGLVEGGGMLDWPMVTVDGTFVTCNDYVNISGNGYWERKQRRS